ncbi:GNAT family N-acetyltransferase [Actinomadura graeca]|uniref:GNAT family N-acetyltransferase n=1 Tax=Actinomadura graeca TaxID=2750812 RepID=A0ABX8R7C7_9ACTN|nr:GNAT family N-acetyltransferase [Actinomadura graeca]QXJ25852.1 GNAT family N-acetyltransferase [Actinomadura graeca]
MNTDRVPGATPGDVTLRRFNATGARAQREVVSQIHRGAYAERIAAGSQFDSVEAFMNRFDVYVQREGFDLVIAYDNTGPDARPVGQTWGWPLGPQTAWWKGLEIPPEPSFTEEDGSRTFALSEIMVCRPWTGRGIAHALHDALLRPRTEQRATLLVRPDNPAYAIYTRWGWRKATQLRPGLPDAPLMDVLIMQLPLAPPGPEH